MSGKKIIKKVIIMMNDTEFEHFLELLAEIVFKQCIQQKKKAD